MQGGEADRQRIPADAEDVRPEFIQRCGHREAERSGRNRGFFVAREQCLATEARGGIQLQYPKYVAVGELDDLALVCCAPGKGFPPRVMVRDKVDEDGRYTGHAAKLKC